MEATGPYYVPRLVDTGGNNTGLVCAKPQPDSVRDNDCNQGGEVACLLEYAGCRITCSRTTTVRALKGP